jgi:hypothetical protein
MWTLFDHVSVTGFRDWCVPHIRPHVTGRDYAPFLSPSRNILIRGYITHSATPNLLSAYYLYASLECVNAPC